MFHMAIAALSVQLVPRNLLRPKNLVWIMAAAALGMLGVEVLGILLDNIGMTITAMRGKGDCLTVGMAAGDSIMTGSAAEFGVRRVAKFLRIDISFGTYFCLITMASHTRIILSFAVAKRITRPFGRCVQSKAGKKQEPRYYDQTLL